jgi:hypothetical protein
MPRVHFQLHTALGPDVVLAALTDFGPGRAAVWPNIDAEHLVLHGSGPGWADVTEGSAVAGGVWERNRYEWDAGDGRLTATTQESNAWAPGSRWEYRLAPASDGGTAVDVHVVRTGRGAKGRLLGLAIGIVGTSRLRGDMEKALARVAAQRGAG